MRNLLCKLGFHQWKPHKWKNHLLHLNTGGNYIRNEGGEYKEYICLNCKEKTVI